MSVLELPSPLRAPALLAPHGFFTRRGGVSTGPFASLNASLSGSDRTELVLENRARAARAIGVEPGMLVGLTQIHGADAIRVEAPWPAGSGPRADAMASNRPGIALGIITADCAPVLLADPVAGVIGAAHAGWRGAASGVLEATLAAMTGLGARTRRIVAAIGPCIGQASYEVGPDLRDAVLAGGRAVERFFRRGRTPDRWQFDLAGLCAFRLNAAGVAVVAAIGRDTFIEERDFFSHRRRTLAGGGPIGHQIAIIALPSH